MPQSIEFTVRSPMFADAMETARSALVGRGFTIEAESDRGFVATRGSRRLTTALGAFVPRGRQFIRLEIEALHRPLGVSTVLLRPGTHGTATAGGPIGARRRRAYHRWAADGIERALVATGAFVGRVEGRI